MLEAADEGMLRSRPSAGVWSPIEYTAHLGEALGWYVARVRRVLYEEAPQPVDRRHPPTTAGNEQRRNHAGDDMLILQEACRLLRVPEGTLRHWHADLVIWLTEQTNRDRGR